MKVAINLQTLLECEAHHADHDSYYHCPECYTPVTLCAVDSNYKEPYFKHPAGIKGAIDCSLLTGVKSKLSKDERILHNAKQFEIIVTREYNDMEKSHLHIVLAKITSAAKATNQDLQDENKYLRGLRDLDINEFVDSQTRDKIEDLKETIRRGLDRVAEEREENKQLRRNYELLSQDYDAMNRERHYLREIVELGGPKEPEVQTADEREELKKAFDRLKMEKNELKKENNKLKYGYNT